MHKLFITIATLIFSQLTSIGAHAKEDRTNALALAESWLDAQRAYDRVPGLSAAIVHDQELLWSGASGFENLENKQPAKVDTIYGICSISKLFTGIAVMQMRDEGKLSLDEPVANLLPWYNLEQTHEDSPEVTLQAILTHSAGLPREADAPYWVGPDFPFPSREEIRQLMGNQNTLYPADRYYQYSNLGLSLAGEIVAEKSGEDYEGYVRKHILTPLQLNDTDTGFPTDDRESRIATGYSYPGRSHELRAMPRYDTRGITPAAGFASTALDLSKFASWQFRVRAGKTGEVLAPNTLREMQRVQWMDWDWGSARGLAFGVYRVGDRTLTGHAGDCPGFNTRLYLDPVSLYAVSVLANRNRVDVDGYARVLFDIIEADSAPPKNNAAPKAENLDDYVGSYNLQPWDGEDLVFRWKDGLAIVTLPSMNPVQNMVMLKQVAGDRFHTTRSDDEPGHELVFKRDNSGKVTHLTYHSIVLPRM